MTIPWALIAAIALRNLLVMVMVCKLFGYSIDEKAAWAILMAACLTGILDCFVDMVP